MINLSPGLLFADSPEPRHELVCERKDCMIIFSTVEEKINHALTVHLPKDPKKHEWFIRSWKEFVLPARPSRRWLVTQQEMTNRKDKKCHCGKSKEEWDSKLRRVYCSDTCSNDWYNKTLFWSQYRYQILSSHATKLDERYGWNKYEQKCDGCGKITNSIDENWDVDHIIAIMNGGHPWDKRNLQVLCEECHKEKTRMDHAERREKLIEDSISIEEETVIIEQKHELPIGQMTL